MEYMNLLLFEPTSHCLAAFTRSATGDQAPSPLKPADAVGEALELRDLGTGDVLFHVAADRLDSVVVPLDGRVLQAPLRFARVEDLLEEQRGNGIAPVLETLYSGGQLEVHNAFRATEVWVQIEGPALSGPILRKLDIPADASNPPDPLALLNTSETLTLRSGTYDTLIFAPGIRVVFDQILVP